MATASLENPRYTVYMVSSDGKTKYHLTPAVLDIDMSNQEKQVAQCVTIKLANVKTGSTTINSLIDVRNRIFIYCNDGSKNDEVFRGFVWTKYNDADVDARTSTIKCYDNLIYLQESEDSLFFAKGKNTKSVMSEICKRWGITLNYTYSTITHGKLVLKGNLTNIFRSDILDLVKERTGKKYVITSQKDVMYVKPVGKNTTIYTIRHVNNAIVTREATSMDDMVTKVQILGKSGKSGKVPVVATIKGDTAKYGTLQKIQTKNSDQSLSDAKKEANATIKEYGKPQKEYQVTATDIPWIQKGDLVRVEAGSINRNLIAVGIERTINNQQKKMTLDLVDP